MINKLLAEWILECEEEATVETLLLALSHENFTDIKMKVEELINININIAWWHQSPAKQNLSDIGISDHTRFYVGSNAFAVVNF